MLRTWRRQHNASKTMTHHFGQKIFHKFVTCRDKRTYKKSSFYRSISICDKFCDGNKSRVKEQKLYRLYYRNKKEGKKDDHSTSASFKLHFTQQSCVKGIQTSIGFSIFCSTSIVEQTSLNIFTILLHLLSLFWGVEMINCLTI